VKEEEGAALRGAGRSDALVVGRPALAVGNPFMLGTRTGADDDARIISALQPLQALVHGRDPDRRPDQSRQFGRAALHDGGEGRRINGRIEIRRFQNRVNTGIGYAIPPTRSGATLPLLKSGGRVRHGFVHGITVGECGDPGYDNVGRLRRRASFIADSRRALLADRAG